MKRVLGLLSASALAVLLVGQEAPAVAQDYGFGGSSFLYTPQRFYKQKPKFRPVRTVGRSFRPKAKARVVRAKSPPVQEVASVELAEVTREVVVPVKVRMAARDAQIEVRRQTAVESKPVAKTPVENLPAEIVEARAQPTSVANGRDPLQLVVSIPDQKLAVFRGDRQIDSARVSTGRDSHPTPSGIFSIIQKNRIHFSNLYESAPMPFMQRITWSGLALHAGNVSRPYASHGCVRLPYGFAQTLFRRTEMGAHVIIAAAGMSTPRRIEHDILPQPGSAVAMTTVENVGTATSGRSDGLEGAAVTDEAAGGIPNFVPPVEAAANRLEAAGQEREQALAAIAGLEAKRNVERTSVEKQRTVLETAQKAAAVELRNLEEAESVAARAARRLAAQKTAHAKVLGRTNWAKTIVDKRRDDPRFEGEWMTRALARLADREIELQAEETSLAEARKDFESADAVRGIAVASRRKAREHVETESDELAAADARLRQAEVDVVLGKRKATQADNEMKRATAELRASQQREKMPLRLVITPLNKSEKIKIAQRLLAELGYEGIEPVGYIGKQTTAAIRDVEQKLDLRPTGTVTEDLIAKLYGLLGREQTTNAHLYVRQGFLDLFDLPVIIHRPDEPLGTHVFTAMHFEDGDARVEWTALTVKERSALPATIGRRHPSPTAAKASRSARDVLDRINIPENARRQLSSMLTPGSSIVITDNGINGRETGKGTDFVVSTR